MKKNNIMNSTILSCESGRSMVEMLGVLAIIGVLTIGGLAGYNYAMRSHKTNEIINGASTLYTLGISSNGGSGNAEMTYSVHVGDVPAAVSEMTYKPDRTVVVAIDDVDICNEVKKKLGDKAGDCTAATSPATGYNLTVTLGDATVTQNNGIWHECKGDYEDPHCDDVMKSCYWKVGEYPHCWEPDCSPQGTCACDVDVDQPCTCLVLSETFPNCSRPTCCDTGVCECDDLVRGIACTYGGEYPNCQSE